MEITISRKVDGTFAATTADAAVHQERHHETGLPYGSEEVDSQVTIEVPGAYEVVGGGFVIDLGDGRYVRLEDSNEYAAACRLLQTSSVVVAPEKNKKRQTRKQILAAAGIVEIAGKLYRDHGTHRTPIGVLKLGRQGRIPAREIVRLVQQNDDNR